MPFINWYLEPDLISFIIYKIICDKFLQTMVIVRKLLKERAETKVMYGDMIIGARRFLVSGSQGGLDTNAYEGSDYPTHAFTPADM